MDIGLSAVLLFVKITENLKTIKGTKLNAEG